MKTVNTRKMYSEYNNHKINLEKLTREFSILPPVCEYGYITGCVGLPLADRIFFQNKLELCLRISCSHDRITHVINDVKYENTYPHFLIKPPRGSYCLTEITQRDVFYILYSPETMDFFRKKGLVDDNLCWDIELTPAISNLVNLLKEMISQSATFGFADKVDLLCIQLVEELVLLKRKKNAVYFPETANINRIVSYFNVHYCDNFSLDELISVNGLSRSSFFRHWSKHYQISPAKYMMNLRINEAKRILAETNSSVDDIAMILKFRSSTYFCSVFKNICGCTPLQYRSQKRITKSGTKSI